MVMVANKKSQDQMTEDLSLFLGNNTIRFTVWYVSEYAYFKPRFSTAKQRRSVWGEALPVRGAGRELGEQSRSSPAARLSHCFACLGFSDRETEIANYLLYKTVGIG